MMRLSIHPGVTVEDTLANTGLDILIPEAYELTHEPTAEDLRIQREEVDPHGYFIGRA